ncbi:hypothetical protein ACFUGD_01335 [Streptomyces sp. NPDC057217]|uniref:hypothetical protein n=1 Tax=Streptomyces sp. NPDC057217 TaxID=3346054 RepID=UPI00362895AB
MKVWFALTVCFVVLFGLVALGACTNPDTAQSPGIEIDIDGPKHKAKKPSVPKAPAYKAPKVGRR